MGCVHVLLELNKHLRRGVGGHGQIVASMGIFSECERKLCHIFQMQRVARILLPDQILFPEGDPGAQLAAAERDPGVLEAGP